jgi:hypothetical protein
MKIPLLATTEKITQNVEKNQSDAVFYYKGTMHYVHDPQGQSIINHHFYSQVLRCL